MIEERFWVGSAKSDVKIGVSLEFMKYHKEFWKDGPKYMLTSDYKSFTGSYISLAGHQSFRFSGGPDFWIYPGHDDQDIVTVEADVIWLDPQKSKKKWRFVFSPSPAPAWKAEGISSLTFDWFTCQDARFGIEVAEQIMKKERTRDSE